MSRIGNSLFQMQILLVDAKKRNAPDVIVQAFEDSVEALEQQPCEDAISREAVDEYITNLLSGYLYDEERTRLEDLSAFVWELPPVIPTRPTAQWERSVDDYNKCSNCGKLIKYYYDYKYCPNCGAKMTESEDA